jgi:hypothetical protein
MLKSGLWFQPAERAAAHVICAFGAMVLALIAGGFQARTRGQSTELKTIRVLNYENARPDAAVFLAFDDSHAYLATPDGLFRTDRSLRPEAALDPLGLADRQINNLYVHRNVLYVLLQSEETTGGRATSHSFLRSEDRGQTFIPMDQGLEECYSNICHFLTPTQAAFREERIFLNAGGGLNLLVSEDRGASWRALSGSLNAQACYSPAFELIGRQVVMGGECPLDRAYLRRGTLRADLLGWEPGGDLRETDRPDLENRNVMVIEGRPNSPVVFAGAEGVVLKSDDFGQSFRPVLEYPISGGEKYPYPHRMLLPAHSVEEVLIGGFDKAVGRPYLARTRDDGTSWEDLSRLAGWVEQGDICFIVADPYGRVLIGINDDARRTVTIAELPSSSVRPRPGRPRFPVRTPIRAPGGAN